MAFDTRSHVRDAKSGKIILEQNYALHMSPEGSVYERPMHSGEFYNIDGVRVNKDGSVLAPAAEKPAPAAKEAFDAKLAELKKGK